MTITDGGGTRRALFGAEHAVVGSNKYGAILRIKTHRVDVADRVGDDEPRCLVVASSAPGEQNGDQERKEKPGRRRPHGCQCTTRCGRFLPAPEERWRVVLSRLDST